jgi:alpha-L-rhamnosidase
MDGWSETGFAESGWEEVRTFDPPRITLNASASPRVRKIGEIRPRTISEPAPGVFVFDLGQNMVGWARLAVEGAAGTTVTLRFAEVLNPDGTIYTASLRAARCTDQYTLRGGGRETYEPRFAFHGFRYVEITGYPGHPTLDAITGVVLHSDFRPTGTFECSNAMLNQLQSNIVWGQKGNFLEVPTDCPQRDERLGWTGDAQMFCRTACFNADVAGFFTKWILDLADAQSPTGAFPMMAPELFEQKKGDGGPAWADAGIICPWTIYLCYGDTRILERSYEAMLRYMDYLEMVDYKKRHCFGDWLNVGDPTPKDLISMAFNGYDAKIMSNIACVLRRQKDSARFGARFKRIRAEFNREFVTPNGRLAGDSQTAYVLALHFDLLPPSLRRAATARFVQRIHECNDHLSTGFVGTPYLLDVLTRFGHLDLAYKLLLNEDFPSWGYPIKHGATTMWERWDGWRHDKGFQDPGMNSFNHYGYGAVGDWMYRTILGINLDEKQPGYRHFFIRPIPGGGLTWARGEYHSVHGPIRSSWKIERTGFVLEVTVPVNTTATVQLPGRRSRPIRVGSGTHRFASGAKDA